MNEPNMSDRPKSVYFVRKAAPTSPVASTTAAAQVKPAPILNIAGTRTSLQNNQLITPIGIPSVDFFIGKYAAHFVLFLF
jgi:hypothetical protein